ncbi:hypothetical protein ASG06_07710 [Rathayibacter sp. Leaf185]|nr:hypothetical protein ASF42_07710 [Rathayibacter sp. Leaf294]KQS11858.1 hypothetical protein ASG06_07710 [Rathayibacter sp. Leaf185]
MLASSILIDLVFTPAINGGYTSADNPPGLGLIGAVFLAIGGALMLRVAMPYRGPAAGAAGSRGDQRSAASTR